MKYVKYVATLSALSIILVFMGCDIKNDKTKTLYYPMDESLKWVYHVSSGDDRSKAEKQVLLMEKTNLGNLYVKNLKVAAQQIDFKGKSVIKYIKNNDQGVYEFAEAQSDARRCPVIIDPPNFYIRTPMLVGSAWKENYATRHMMQPIIVPVEVIIQSLHETVTVPAGTFHNCLKLRKFGQMEINNGEFLGVSKTTIEENSWYDPNVGLVKSEFSEISTHRMSGTGHEVMELASFSKK